MSLAACMSPSRAGVGTPGATLDQAPGTAGGPDPTVPAPTTGADETISPIAAPSGGDAGSGPVPVEANSPENAKVPVLDRTPVEVLVEVFTHLDMATVHSLAATNRRFAGIFAANRTAIVLQIAEVEFTPFDGLLQVVKASASDTSVPWGTWLDKRIRRKNTVLCPGGTLPDAYASRIPGPKVSCAEARFEDWDVDKLLSVCRVVRGWERVFPQHRFNASPSSTRSLSPREGFRLRRALYTWMRYAFYFHGDLPRPNLFIPAGRDMRINQLRVLPNSQLSELKDLWVTVEDIVELNVCPSIDNVRIGADFELTEKDAARIGWGKQRENRIVVATVRKLSPKEILYYLDNAHKYTKLRLIQDIRQRHPHFEADTESLSHALACVVSERWRQMLYDISTTPVTVAGAGAGGARGVNPLSNALHLPVFSRVTGKSGGGILDWVDAEAEASCASLSEMTALGLDWRPDESHVRSRAEIPTGMLDP
ncbi:f-box domain-containing protein [Ophiostoma piceae UAMH 11346]|uniref:F-box domain-containing protein n=1 Tax=Ophiostoma piceae (strain UAMH 11346) TaxID=1262450 RepID=S3D371_OPHP1|nr:f-box domain-containing protein [Ophiostoma piceae UAMH 11346]